MVGAGFWVNTSDEPTQRTPRTQRKTLRFEKSFELGVLRALCVGGTMVLPLALQISDDRARGQRSRAAIEPGARMRSASAKIQAVDWRPVTRPTKKWSRDEPLIGGDLAVKDVPAGQPVRPLEVDGRDDCAGNNRRFKSGCVLLDGLGDDRR